MGLESIVNVQITRGTRSVSQAGFGTPMVLGLHTRFAERSRRYSSADAMLDDGFLTSDAEYKSVNSIFSQSKKVRQVVVGRRTAAVAQVVTFTPVVANLTLYTITINGTAHSYTSDADATAAEICGALITAINGGAQASKVTATGTTTVIVTADGAGEAFSYSSTANIPGVLSTPNNGVIEDIAAVREEDDDWYCLLLTSRTALDIRLAASAIEAMRKIFGACSDDSDVITNVSTDIASILEAANYFRTFYLWSDDQANFPEAAWAGRVLPNTPGTETWAFKTLAGITASDLTDSEITNLKNKKANYYILLGGVDITLDGKVSGGEWIDVIRLIDEIEARIQEGIYSKLVNLEKIPFTDAGIAIIEAEIRAVLLPRENSGALVPGSSNVFVPKAADVPSADRANRLLSGVEFETQVAGAIHATDIAGFVSV